MVDKLYHRANPRSSLRPIARFVVEIQCFVCDRATPPITRGGHVYTCCTDTRDRDQSEIKRSSCKIGDDQAIKMSVCTAQIKVKMGPVL